MLVAQKISYTRHQRFLTREISMHIPEGAFFTLAGPNGAGKSTLLRQLTGAIQPTHGRVLLKGKDLREWKKLDLALVRGVLSQYTQVAFTLSVLDIVLLGRYAYGGVESSAKQLQVAEWALDLVNMTAFANRNIQTLSGGEQQRVHLARVLAQIYHPESLEGRYLFLDEPTSSLDIAQQYRMLQVLQQLSVSQGLTVGVILHDLNLAARFSDFVFLLKNGRMHTFGTPEQALQPETISRVFGIPISYVSTNIKQHNDDLQHQHRTR